ncbi:hypothetical protein FRC10_001122 [Ceratobasidium sp. 414]|nr:hypothetical protein FRC10_001122 [Ceratobasidium sp. 414]
MASPSTTTGAHTNDEDSEHSSPTPNTSKRARRSTHQPKPKRKQPSLAGIIHIPMDIFAEITSYLDPTDILCLARTTKHFRALLMQPAAKHIWSAAERNVLGLPPCPEHMNEPAYAALVFGKSCSECGMTVNRRMDAVLGIKLCNNCREKLIVGRGIPTASTYSNLYPLSFPAIKSPTHYSPSYALISCVNAVVSAISSYASTGDSAGFKAWEQKRKALLAKQQAFSDALSPFLDSVDEKRDDQVEELKARRFAAIKARLMQIGWEEADCHITHYSLLRDWQKLVAQPKPLTDRIWDNILPKLVPILATNRNERLARERKQRKRDRVVRVHGLLAELRDSMRQFVELDAVSLPGPPETAVLPFPNQKAVFGMPVVKSLLRENVSGDRATELFGERREEIMRNVESWRYRLEEELGKMTDKVGGGGLMSLLTSTKRYWEFNEWDYSSTEFTEQSIKHVSGISSRKVLRADSVFQLGKPGNWSTTCYFYPNVIDVLQAHLDSKRPHSVSYDTDGSDGDEGYNSDGRRQPLDLSGVTGHTNGKRAAKRLLRCLGRPHAAYLEMKAIGQRFVCGRCWVQKPMGWAEIVEHYANSQPGFSTTKHWYAHQGVKFNNEHETLEDRLADDAAAQKESRTKRRYRVPSPLVRETESQSERMPVSQSDTAFVPESQSARPLVKILSFEEAEEALGAASVPGPVKCRICESVAQSNGDHFGGPMPRPEGSREVVIRHLVDVHELPEEKWEMVLKIDQ